MPRSAADRAFGLRAPDLVRIIAAADGIELLDAFDELGIELIDRPGLGALFGRLITLLVKPVDIIVSLVTDLIGGFEAAAGTIDQAILDVRLAIAELEAHPSSARSEAALGLRRSLIPLVAAGSFLDNGRAEALRLELEIEKQRRAFRERLEAAAEEVESGTATVSI